jgi:SAM-dependent methyltransferase
MSSQSPDMKALKERLRSTWMAGDFGQIAQYSAPTAEEFVSRLQIASGARVLDVACGTGNLSIPAARCKALVTGVDIAPNLLEQARKRAESEGLKVQFDEGDAEQLSYEDASFDIVITMFGAMFAPRPDTVAAELIRVCRSGGRIAMANWTPEGFVGQMFKLGAQHVPPPQGMPPPALWGDEDTVRMRLRDGISDLKMTKRKAVMKFPFEPADVVEFFRRYFGPTQRAFDSLDEEKQRALREDLEGLWLKNNQATDGNTQVEAEYLEVIALRS